MVLPQNQGKPKLHVYIFPTSQRPTSARNFDNGPHIWSSGIRKFVSIMECAQLSGSKHGDVKIYSYVTVSSTTPQYLCHCPTKDGQ